MTIINSIAWNVSNIFGAYSSLDQFLNTHKCSSLNLILGPKCNASCADIQIYHHIFDQLNLQQVRIYRLPKYLYLLYCFFPFLFSKFSFEISIFLLPTPANPPITFLTPWILIYYYGDGLGSKPMLSYQWQPNISNSALISKVRSYLMMFNYCITKRLQQPVDISPFNLDRPTYIKSLVQCFSICFSDRVSTFIEQFNLSECKKLHIFVLSVISPVRAHFSNEVLLYTDFVMRHIGRVGSNETLIIKFHYHHDQKFRKAFIEALRAKALASFRIIEFTPTAPAESIIVAFNQLLPSSVKYFYTFQQSFVLMCDIASFLNTELLHLNFGFDDDLVLQYFYPDEVSKRLDYQHAMLLETKNFTK